MWRPTDEFTLECDKCHQPARASEFEKPLVLKAKDGFPELPDGWSSNWILEANPLGDRDYHYCPRCTDAHS